MKWTPEMEGEFIDLEIMEDILEEKRTVKGNFDTGIYIKETKIDFEQIAVLNREMELWFPKGVEKKEHYGMEFIYPQIMGVYEEYADTEHELYFTIEKLNVGTCVNQNILEIKEEGVEEIQNKYEDTVITEIDNFKNKGMQVELVMAEGMIGDELEEYAGYIFLIATSREIYRYYIFSKDAMWEIVYKLGIKIVKDIELKEG